MSAPTPVSTPTVPTPLPPAPPAVPAATDSVTYTRTYADLAGSTITTKINSRWPECLYQDANSLDISIVDNYATPPGGAGIGAHCVTHEINARTGGGETFHEGADLQAEARSGFNITRTTMAHAKRMHGGIVDTIWPCAFSPNSKFATHPDPKGIIHSFDAGWIRIGEVNCGNAWGDFGILFDRSYPSRVVCGLEAFPDWVVGSEGDMSPNKYHASWAWSTGGAAPGANGRSPKFWIGHLTCLNGIVGKLDHADMLPGAVAGNTSGGGGYAYQVQGSSDPENPIGKGFNFAHAMDVGVDMREATFTDAAMLLADDQAIRLGSVWLRGHQGHVQVSVDAVNWRNL